MTSIPKKSFAIDECSNDIECVYGETCAKGNRLTDVCGDKKAIGVCSSNYDCGYIEYCAKIKYSSTGRCAPKQKERYAERRWGEEEAFERAIDEMTYRSLEAQGRGNRKVALFTAGLAAVLVGFSVDANPTINEFDCNYDYSSCRWKTKPDNNFKNLRTLCIAGGSLLMVVFFAID